MYFIKVKAPIKKENKESIVKKMIRFFFEKIIPKANPDFEEKIPLVFYWLIEFDDYSSTPSREIGLSKEGDVLVKMPFNKNVGYWVDNNLTLKDFEGLFSVEYFEKEYFEKKWTMLT